MKTSFLVLDHNHSEESYSLLRSLHDNVKIDKEIIFFSNGGRQDYVADYYSNGLIDTLILNKQNTGCGFGTTDLVKFSRSKYAFYIQSDQWLSQKITNIELDEWVKLFYYQPELLAIGLAGDQCQGKYSERAQIFNTELYNRIPNKPNGGPGPFHHLEWNEGYIQQWTSRWGLTHQIWPKKYFEDVGCWAKRENPDGSIFVHRSDTKQLWIIKKPTQKYVYPKFTNEEWEKALAGKWENGTIPQNEKEHSFMYWKVENPKFP